METIRYLCGCESHRAYNKRGANRLRIIAEIESRSCHNCAMRNYAAKLTRIDGTPYTQAEQDAFVAKRIKSV